MEYQYHIISKEFDFKQFETNSSNLIFFVDTFMTTEINTFLKQLSTSKKLRIFMLNKGHESEVAIEDDRQEVLLNITNDIVNTVWYREYKLLNIADVSYIDAKVAIVSDEIQFTTFENSTNLLYVNPNTIDEVLAADVDVLLFITTWAGMFKEYDGILRDDRTEMFRDYISRFKERSIPVAFYSKEDPPNFNIFKSLVTNVDFVYTSSIDKVIPYRRINSKVNVKAFTYGINPGHNNPTLSINEEDKVMFAGTWYNGKYIDRMLATKSIFNSIHQSDVDFTFYNRNYYRDTAMFKLPDMYKKYEKPAIPYSELVEKYREFKYHINLNSVITDPTMFAVRVLELQAMGKKIISNYSLPIYVDYPNIDITKDEFNMEFSIEDKILGIRNTFKDNSIFDFWEGMLEGCGLKYLVPTTPNTTISKDLNHVALEDVKCTFKYADANNIVITTDESKYYTYSDEIETTDTVVASIESECNNKYIYIPSSRYYNFDKKLVIANLHNYKNILELDSEQYVVALDDDISYSKFIVDTFKNNGFEMLCNYQIRQKQSLNQNENALALINFLKYTEQVELVSVVDGQAEKVGTIDYNTSSFRNFILRYKKSIVNNESFDFTYSSLTYSINSFK